MQLKNRVLVFAVIFSLIACDDIIEETDISEKQITVLAPLDGSNVPGNQVSFNWNLLEEADSYRVQVAQPNFGNATQILMDSLVVRDTLDQIANRVQLGLLNGNYQWRIKGLNSGFETPFAIMGFTVNGDANADLIAPNTPVLVAPIDGATQDETNVAFLWTREDISGSAEKDSIYIYTDVDLQNLETKGLGANKSYDATLSTNTFYWVVQAFDAAGNKSGDSDVFSLTIN